MKYVHASQEIRDTQADSSCDFIAEALEVRGYPWFLYADHASGLKTLITKTLHRIISLNGILLYGVLLKRNLR